MTDLSNLTVELRDDQLVLATGRLERRFAWNGGHLISTRLALPDGPCWEYPADRPDLMIPGVLGLLGGGRLEVVDQSATAAFAAHRRAVVTCSVGELEIRRVFRLYPDCPAIACDIYLRGRADGPWRSGEPRPYSIPSVARVGTAPGEACSHLGWPLFAAPVTDRIATGTRHLKVEIAAFADVTDVRNNLVSATRVLPYRAPSPHQGNVLLAVDSLSDEGCFMLREAPCSDMQLAWPGCDFIVARGDLVSVGLGLDPEDLDSDGWTRTYGVVVGLTAHGELGVLQALRAYQRAIRVVDPGRDHLVMANTWGDRSRDERVSESFSLGEIEAGRVFGISHLQLDDGWQTGRSGMSVEGGSLEGIWDRGDWWAPRPERFPRGLAPVVERGRQAGVEVCLWFNPSKDNSYAHWEDDARTLVGLFREHGIRVFKIDGVDIPDKRADLNLRAMFDRVLEETNHEVTFNLDATASRRFGYHYLNEYGTIFLANRYTDSASYYPHWTLRNLWQLARYVPAQNLQMEFLNRWRNSDQYPADDPLAPSKVPFDYCFAVTMAAQPLAWFEVQNLPAAGREIAPLVRAYRAVQPELHGGCILPVGDEPDGTSWPGFQSVESPQQGLLLAYRECNDQPVGYYRLFGTAAGERFSLTPVLGHGQPAEVEVDASGHLAVALPRPFSFALYRYARR